MNDRKNANRLERRVADYQAHIARSNALDQEYTYPADDIEWEVAERRYQDRLTDMLSRVREAVRTREPLTITDDDNDYFIVARGIVERENQAETTAKEAFPDMPVRVFNTDQEAEVRRIAKEEWDRRDEIDMSGILAVVQARVAVDVAEAIDTYDHESEPRVVDLINVALAKAWADTSTFGDKTGHVSDAEHAVGLHNAAEALTEYQPDGRITWRGSANGGILYIPDEIAPNPADRDQFIADLTDAMSSDGRTPPTVRFNKPWRVEQDTVIFGGDANVEEITESDEREDAPTIKGSITRNADSLYEEVRLLRALNTDLLNLLRFDGRL